MPHFTIDPLDPGQLRGLRSTELEPCVPACRAHMRLVTDPPLDRRWFPGPALRGLLGHSLERLATPAALAFLRQRFRSGASGAPSPWRLAFTTPPDDAGSTFDVEVATFGPEAADDLAAVADALDLPGLALEVPGRSFRIRLLEVGTPDAACLRLPEPPPPGQSRPPGGGAGAGNNNEPLPHELAFLTPLMINRRGRRLTADDLAADPAPLAASLRLRFADLAHLRRRDPRLAAPVLPPVDDSELADVRLHLPLQGDKQTLRGIIGRLRWHRLAPEAVSLLALSDWLGAGRGTTFGCGTTASGDDPVPLDHGLPPGQPDQVL